MNGTPMRLVILVLAFFGGVALIGAIALKMMSQQVPNEMWMIVTGASSGIGGLLANPRSGMESRASDTIKTDTIETESLKVGSGA